MEIRAGTSGYSYPAWKGHFYPDDLPQKQMLSYYSSQLPCVEINNTFYRLPSEKMLAGWLEQTSEPFSFVLKASRRITHFGKLEDVDDTLRHLLQTTAVLGDRLGAHLFQLPPYLKKDVARLGAFLELLPAGTRAAFEFRNTSWFDDETYALLADHDAALVVADGGKVEVPFVSTATWGYLRLRRDAYEDADLDAWVDRVRGQTWSRAFVFFKHEDEGAGPRMAARFLEAASQ